MNTDTTDELLPEGSDRFRLNVRVLSSDNSTVGSIETVKGNTLVSFSLPAGANKVIGTKEDLLRKKVYYFVYNASFNHTILEFDSVLNSITTVFQDSINISGGQTNILNFSTDNLITGINIVEIDPNNHLLYWTDNRNEPRKINIEKGIYFMSGNHTLGYATPFDPEILYRIKQPMLRSPECVYGDDSDVKINRLIQKLFQFKVQFVYDDHDVSSWSPISKTCFPLSNFTDGVNNLINVTVDTGIEIVKLIRIAVKEVNAADYRLVVELNKEKEGIASNSTYVYKFFNDGIYLPLLSKESTKLFDNVPLLSQSQEVIYGNRMSDGLITEGFDPVDVDLKIGMEINKDVLTYSVDYIQIIDGGSAQIHTPYIPFTISGDGTGATVQYTGLEIDGVTVTKNGFYTGVPLVSFEDGGGTGMLGHATMNAGGVDTIVIDDPGTGYTYSPNIKITGGGEIVGATAVAYMKVTRIDVVNPGSGYTSASIAGTLPGFPAGFIGAVVLTAENFVAINALKRGGVYTYGLIYGDHGNRTGLTNVNNGRFDVVQPNGCYGTTLFVPFYTELNSDNAAQLAFTMNVDDVLVTLGGSGYTGATVVTFSAPGSGTTATGTPVIGTGEITELTPTDAGSGYTPDGTYTNIALLGGTGAGATVDLEIVGGVVVAAQINNTGTGYLTGDSLTVDPSTFAPPPGVDATFDVISDFQTVTDITIVSAGSGYISVPTVTITDSGGGTGAAVSALMKIDAVTIINGGSGYAAAPTVTFVGGSPTTNATLTTTISSGSVVSTTITNAGAGYFSFPILQIDGLTYGGSYPEVNWEIYNRPPDWATHYQIARVKNSANSRYIQFLTNTIAYRDRDSNQLNYGDPAVISMDITIDTLVGAGLVYDFVKGDRIRFIMNYYGTFYPDYFDYEINAYNSGTSIIHILFTPGQWPSGVPDLSAGVLFEIYQPGREASANEKIAFEIGECHDILTDVNGDKYHEGSNENQSYWDFNSSSNTFGFVTFSGSTPHGLPVGAKIKIKQNAPFNNPSYDGYAIVEGIASATSIRTNIAFGVSDPSVTGSITAAATGDFVGGDTFYRPRIMTFGSPLQYFTRLIEDANYSDIYLSPGYDYGRPNRIDPEFRRITRPSTVYYSEKFVPETFINGLSTVYDDSFESYMLPYGGIYKLYAEDQDLIVFQELKIGKVLVEQIMFNGTQGGSVVGQSSDILPPSMQYYGGEFGIGKNPESFSVYAKAKYGVDPRRGTPWRLSIDGLTPVGDTGNMHNYFNDKCRAILAHSGRVNIYGVFDVKFNEYIAAFDAFDIYPAETIAWNERANGWSTFYSYQPEFMSSNGVDIISFKDGSLYTHNTNSVYNNFYGVQYASEVWSVLNAEPSNVKIFEAVSEECLTIWEVPEISNTNGQLSNLVPSDFQMLEGMQYAPLWRDTNTPNVVAPALALFEGDEMRAQTFLVKFRYDGTTYNKLFAVNFKYIISNLHT